MGLPLPGVQTKVVRDDTTPVFNPHLCDGEDNVVGELRVQGPAVFREYFGRPEATAKEFDEDHYFRTGDIVEYSRKVRLCAVVVWLAFL